MPTWLESWRGLGVELVGLGFAAVCIYLLATKQANTPEFAISATLAGTYLGGKIAANAPAPPAPTPPSDTAPGTQLGG